MQPLMQNFSTHLLDGRTYGKGLASDSLVLAPASMLNAASGLLLPEQSFELMVMNHRENFLNDALVSNFAVHNQNGEIELQLINKTEESFVGSLFEAWVCRELIQNPTAGLNAFRWATGRSGARPTTYSRFVPYVTASPVLKDDIYTSQFYNTGDASDIRFHAAKPQAGVFSQKPGLAWIDGTTIPAGIQVKAIRTNFLDQIVKPLIENRYQTVLTLLPSEIAWQHSADACRSIVHKLVSNGEISAEEGLYVLGRIKAPAELGLFQFRVDEYANFAREVYARHKRDGFDRVWLNLSQASSEIITATVASAAAAVNPGASPIILPESSAIEIQKVVIPNGWGGLMEIEQANRVPRLGYR